MRRKKKARRGWRKKKRKPALASSIPGFVAGSGHKTVYDRGSVYTWNCYTYVSHCLWLELFRGLLLV